MKIGQSFHWKHGFLLLFACMFFAAAYLPAPPARPSIIDHDLLRDATQNRHNPRYSLDSLVPALEAELKDTALSPISRRALVLNAALAHSISEQGQYTRSAGILLRILPTFESMGDICAQAFANLWLSYNYNMLEQYDRAAGYARTAVTLYTRCGDLQGLSNAFNSVGNNFHKEHQNDSAEYYYQQSALVAAKGDYLYGIARAHNNIANINLAQKQYDLALRNFRAAVSQMQELSHKPAVFFINNIGLAYLKMGKPDSALFYIRMALDSMGTQQDHSLKMNIYGNMSNAYAELGDFQHAYSAQETLISLNQIALNERNFAQLAERDAIYQSEAKQQKIALLEADTALKEQEIARAVDRRNILLGTIVTLLVVAGLGWLAYRNKRQSNKLLSEQKNRIELMNALLEDRVRERTEALSRVNAELDQLLYRSSHDLRTPITKLKGLIGLLEVEKVHGESLKLMSLVSLSVGHLDKLNLSICEAGNIRIHTPKIVNIQLSELVGEIQGKLAHPQLKTQFSPPGGCQVHADKWLLGLAILELLQNALDAMEGREVTVTFTCPSSKAGYEILVADNGPGIPAPLQPKVFELFSKGNNHPGRHGLGLYKARLAVEKMGGKLELLPGEANGSVFRITLQAPAFTA
jgi:signal transduction histidine kinase